MSSDYCTFFCGVGCLVTTPDRTKILLGRRANTSYAGSWGFPGGHVEYGETPQQAAIRELFEETGLLGIPGIVLPPVLTYEKNPYVGIPVTFRSVSGELQPDDKFDALDYFPLIGLPQPLFYPAYLMLQEHLITF